MRTAVTIGTAVLLALAAGCSPVAVSHDHDPDFDFTRPKTYSWLPLRGVVKKHEPVLRDMQAEITAQLEAKGLREKPEGADLLVVLHGSVREKIATGSWGYNLPQSGRYGERTRVAVRHYEEGTVFLEFIDTVSYVSIWHCTATGVVRRSATVEERQARLRKAVAAMLAAFPPPR